MRLITKVANERQEEAAIKKGLGENLKPIEYYQEEVVRDLKAMSKEDRYRFLIDHSPISKSTDPNSIEITKQMRRDIDIMGADDFTAILDASIEDAKSRGIKVEGEGEEE